MKIISKILRALTGGGSRSSGGSRSRSRSTSTKGGLLKRLLS